MPGFGLTPSKPSASRLSPRPSQTRNLGSNKKRLASSGFGARLTLSLVAPSPGLCQKLLDKVGLQGKTFLADDWDGFHRLIPNTSSSPATT
jgi:hypothetical protein